jgi:hypothetical protein
VVEYAGACWRVQRALGVEAVLLRSEAGEEVSADPLKVRLGSVQRMGVYAALAGRSFWLACG